MKVIVNFPKESDGLNELEDRVAEFHAILVVEKIKQLKVCLRFMVFRLMKKNVKEVPKNSMEWDFLQLILISFQVLLNNTPRRDGFLLNR